MWIAVMLIPVVALAAPTTQRGMRNGLPYFKATESISAQGTVVKVDKAHRDVWIRVADGDTVIVTCGPEIKNFAQIAAKDIVKVKYTETLTVHVEEKGVPAVGVESATESAKPGSMPKGQMTQKVKASATIMSIDHAKGTVTLKGQDSNEYVIHPQKKENLSKVKVGQLVVFTYEEAVAASVEKVKK
jgi:hypothetical protein